MKALLTTEDAAEYIGYSEQTLRSSRVSGSLSGLNPPPHVKIGKKSIRYKLTDLDKWIESQDYE